MVVFSSLQTFCFSPLAASPLHALISSPPLPAAAAVSQLCRAPWKLSPEAPLHLPDLCGALAPAAAVRGSSQAQVFPVVEHHMRYQPGFTEHPCNRRSGSIFLRYLFSAFLVLKIQKKSIVFLQGATDCTECVLSLPSFFFFFQRT